MNINNLEISIGIIAGVLVIIGYVTGFFKWAFNRIKRSFSSKEEIVYKIPKKTIVVVPKPDPKAVWWHMGSSGGKPAMQITGDFTVTNITKYNILLTVAKMKKPKALGFIDVKDIKSNYYGNYLIPDGLTTDMSFHFWIMPPFKEKNEAFRADVAILDQFGNEHWIKGIEFRYS